MTKGGLVALRQLGPGVDEQIDTLPRFQSAEVERDHVVLARQPERYPGRFTFIGRRGSEDRVVDAVGNLADAICRRSRRLEGVANLRVHLGERMGQPGHRPQSHPTQSARTGSEHLRLPVNGHDQSPTEQDAREQSREQRRVRVLDVDDPVAPESPREQGQAVQPIGERVQLAATREPEPMDRDTTR